MTSNELDRLLMRNGRGPTQRDQWKAFWRLWRICKKANNESNPFALPAAEMAFHWLLQDKWDWVTLASSPGDRLNTPLSSIPTFIRKMWLQSDTRKRKFNFEVALAKRNGIVCNEIRSKQIAAQVRKNGIEVTPNEVNKIREVVCDRIRGFLTKSGWKEKDIPVSDEGIIMMMRNTSKSQT